MRWLWGTTGFLLLAVGLAALVVPLVPTTPFLVLAAASLMRASPRLERWLVEHPLLGAPIRDWRAGRGVRRGVKTAFLLLTAAGAAVALWRFADAPLGLRLGIAGGALLTAWFFLSLPERPRE